MEENPDQLADDLEQEARSMERRTERLSNQLAHVRQDWERKRADPSVPGAPAPDEETSDDDKPAPNDEDKPPPNG